MQGKGTDGKGTDGKGKGIDSMHNPFTSGWPKI
jgi:hypothetical protein